MLRIKALHIPQAKVAVINSGRTSEVRVTVPETDNSLPSSEVVKSLTFEGVSKPTKLNSNSL
jgi:hypothetical protein